MRNKELVRLTALTMVLVTLLSFSFFSPSAFAADRSVSVDGKIYTFGEKDHYEITTTKYSATTNGKNTYGSFTISGNVTADGTENGMPSYAVNEGNVALIYTYSDALRDAPETKWHLIEDSSKAVADFKLDSNIKKGAIIVQTSKDGKTWINDVELTNVFAESQKKVEPIYTSKSVQLANGCFYRVIVVYETRIKRGEDKVLFVKTSDYDYKKTAEVYEFYLHDAKQSDKDENTQTKALGTLFRAEKENNGYAGGSSTLDLKDPHYGWSLGRFFVSGYTRATKDDAGTPVFLKTVGDQITLWFNLQENIDKLHGSETLSIADDDKGYDKYFQIEKTDMGRGTLIIRYTDEKGVPHTPEVYTNYLEANATTSADTIVRLFEEGDYEVSLDYKIKSVPRKVGGIEVIPEYFDYHISFSFSVRNGNCMVYPFDVKTGQELTDESITVNGFKLDMAKSRYLTIDVKYARVAPGANGYVEDVRFNRPAKDGDAYTDEGIYTFSVKNLYTGESTTKKIYVGDADYLRALSLNNLSVAELNDRVAAGATIESNGTLVSPTPSPAQTDNTAPTPAPTTVPSAKPTNEGTTGVQTPVEEPKSGSVIPIVVIAAVVITGVAFFAVSKKKKKNTDD